MHQSTQSTVIEDVLVGTVSLGVCKSIFDLLSLPAVGASSNSVCRCCCCLLIFTDLTVTVFLAVLWLAKPWMSLFPVPSDVITLRFVLFLGHTYGAVLLLTIPLIAMEMACKWLLVPALGKADRDGPEGGRYEHQRQCDALELEVLGRGEEVGQRNSPGPGFLCCLLAWALCGLWGGQHYVSKQLNVEACILSRGALHLCLPDLASIIQSASSDPFVTLPAVILLLALPLTLSALRTRQTKSPLEQLTQCATVEKAPHVQPCIRQAMPPPPQHATAPTAQSTCLSMAGYQEQSPYVIGNRRVNRLMLPDPCQQAVTVRAHPNPAIRTRLWHVLCETHTRSSCRTLGLSLLVGLLWAAVLYLLPPCLSVNPILFCSMCSLAERSLRH
ncbi:hypothetical protein GJAV_G00176270 [Gymnothorax javanicus]|nr:hypothetical protein GJAV_G00176270 [Gymnothorax javanicus]